MHCVNAHYLRNCTTVSPYICSKTWQTTLKFKQNSAFASRLQTSQLSHETFDLLVWEKKRKEKLIIGFDYLQALGLQNDTLVNGGVQKEKWSYNCHEYETESHRPYFWKVFVLGKIYEYQTHRMWRFCKNFIKNSLGGKTTLF